MGCRGDILPPLVRIRYIGRALGLRFAAAPPLSSGKSVKANSLYCLDSCNRPFAIDYFKITNQEFGTKFVPNSSCRLSARGFLDLLDPQQLRINAIVLKSNVFQ
jgi:hypothetical protein